MAGAELHVGGGGGGGDDLVLGASAIGVSPAVAGRRRRRDEAPSAAAPRAPSRRAHSAADAASSDGESVGANTPKRRRLRSAAHASDGRAVGAAPAEVDGARRSSRTRRASVTFTPDSTPRDRAAGSGRTARLEQRRVALQRRRRAAGGPAAADDDYGLSRRSPCSSLPHRAALAAHCCCCNDRLQRAALIPAGNVVAVPFVLGRTIASQPPSRHGRRRTAPVYMAVIAEAPPLLRVQARAATRRTAVPATRHHHRCISGMVNQRPNEWRVAA